MCMRERERVYIVALIGNGDALLDMCTRAARVCVYVCMHVYIVALIGNGGVCMCVCVCIYIYIYTYIYAA